ncbi:hypothetical protein PQX77_020960 [Marasmius sp. AFHP31]|nr:hypothetical protein PQX77_020960 [Marasmius sp. AFHP31]
MSSETQYWRVFAAALSGNDTWYESYERAGVIVLSVAALLSIIAIIFVAVPSIFSAQKTQKTHIFEYLTCLLIANMIQSVGTAMNLRWVSKNGVTNGAFCVAQGGIKQAGNVATALWTFILALHIFNILFLRSAVTKVGLWCTLVGGWLLVLLLVLLGPLAIQKSTKGPYFGVSGAWCWITNEYPEEQVFLEYFFEFLAASLSFVLYCVILLRVRGNLVHNMGKWQLKFISKTESWRLGFARDLIDSAMLKLAQRMVWLPVAYTLLLIPITITRLTEFSGRRVPFGATIFAAVVFNLTGKSISIIRRPISYSPLRCSDLGALPEFNTPRNKLLDVVFGKTGVTPFTLERSDTADSYNRERQARLQTMRSVSPTPASLEAGLQRTTTQDSTANLITK